MTNTKYGKILAVATSVCVILLGVAFIICCSHLYFTGEGNAYSRERVGDYLVILAIPSFVTVALTICGFIYAYVTGAKDDELIARTNCELLESFSSKFDFSTLDEETKNSLTKIKKRKNIVDLIASEVTAFCVIFMLDFLIISSIDNMKLDIMSALAFSLPLVVVAVAVHIPRVYMSEKSAGDELALLKSYVKNHGAPTTEKKAENPKERKYILITRCAVASVAIIFIVLGIVNGGMNDVLYKAIKICAECIGLG